MNSSIITTNELDDIEIARAIQCDVQDLTQNISTNDNDLKVVCQNIRSVYSNIDDFYLTLMMTKTTPDIN